MGWLIVEKTISEPWKIVAAKRWHKTILCSKNYVKNLTYKVDNLICSDNSHTHTLWWQSVVQSPFHDWTSSLRGARSGDQTGHENVHNLGELINGVLTYGRQLITFVPRHPVDKTQWRPRTFYFDPFTITRVVSLAAKRRHNPDPKSTHSRPR